jgi:hypothetical protein
MADGNETLVMRLRVEVLSRSIRKSKILKAKAEIKMERFSVHQMNGMLLSDIASCKLSQDKCT